MGAVCLFSALEHYKLAILPNSTELSGLTGIFQIAGPNGAGKTTTMRMIIAEENPTRGKIRIGKHNIESNTSPGFDQLGYCPQVSRYLVLSKILNLR